MNQDPAGQSDARHFPETKTERGAEQVAAIFADALLGAAETSSETAESLLEEFDALIEQVLEAYPAFEEILTSIMISYPEKEAMLDRVFSGRASETFLNFLKVLCRHERLDAIRTIHQVSHQRYHQRRGTVPVTVTSATPIDESTADAIGRQLRPLLGGEPMIRRRVDPDVLGGIVVQVGDTIYDASLSTQLHNVRQQMMDRSAHEIQSRRDRFRNPEGN